jgi:hypothetical protein
MTFIKFQQSGIDDHAAFTATQTAQVNQLAGELRGAVTDPNNAWVGGDNLEAVQVVDSFLGMVNNNMAIKMNTVKTLGNGMQEAFAIEGTMRGRFSQLA